MTAPCTFLLLSTGERQALLDRCLHSVAARYPGARLCLVAQDYPETTLRAVLRGLSLDLEVLSLTDRLGPYLARLEGLRRWQAPVWCNLDDDMTLLPETDYAGPALRVQDPTVGIVSCNWVRSPALRKRARPLEDRYLRQPVVYTGGGYVYGPALRTLVLAAPPAPYLFDNVQWSLLAYLGGWHNYRYLGSLAYHAVVGPGGRKAWVRAGDRVPPDPQWITCAPAKDGEPYNMPAASALTPAAHHQHAIMAHSLGTQDPACRACRGR